ncbi:MAG TPA: hypothetical protein VMM78_04485 [Thermomicrobiales bacterium]|nr:hypothetical protein [Thermomicrobiales bacterium]
MQSKKINVGGQDVDAVEVSFSIVREDWNEYELADGGHVRLKTTTQRILRVLDDAGKPARTPDGEPFIVVQTSNQVVASD